MLEALLLFVLIASAAQPTDERRVAALLFSVSAISHHAAMYYVDGWIYYFSAAMLDAFVVMLTIRMRIISPVIESIHAICYVSIVINAFGWCMWMLYMPPDAYNAAFLFVYAWLLITLLKKETSDAGRNSSVGVGYSDVLSASCESNNRNTK